MFNQGCDTMNVAQMQFTRVPTKDKYMQPTKKQMFLEIKWISFSVTWAKTLCVCTSESSSSPNVLHHYQNCKPETLAAAFERTRGGRKSGLLCVTPQTLSLLMKGFSPNLANQRARLQKWGLQHPLLSEIGFKRKSPVTDWSDAPWISMELKLHKNESTRGKRC